MTIPIAIEAEEKTLITVSDDAFALLLTLRMPRPNKMPNITIHTIGFPMPRTTPIAIPVKALCPSASEKNAILLFTAIVPSIPKSGVSKRTARRAFFIKSNCMNEKGRTVSIILYIKSNVSRLLNRISESIGKGFCLIYFVGSSLSDYCLIHQDYSVGEAFYKA